MCNHIKILLETNRVLGKIFECCRQNQSCCFGCNNEIAKVYLTFKKMQKLTLQQIFRT